MSGAAPDEDVMPPDEEKTGYRNPPRHSRFRPGQSGNPKGRPRRRNSMAGLVEEVLAQPVAVTLNGKRKRLTTEAALLMRLREKALGGDLKAMAKLLDLRAAYVPESEGHTNAGQLSAEDWEILTGAGLIGSDSGSADDPA
jgi:Family of unknown function (DUF5681)